MKPPRKFPIFANVTVTDWLNGHQERIYAVVGPFTFSLAVEAGRIVRISRYDKPGLIEDAQFMTSLPPTIKLAEYLIRWSEAYPAERAIAWDDAVLASHVLAARTDLSAAYAKSCADADKRVEEMLAGKAVVA